jgi:ATP-dependent helicase/nuclease subunit A
MSPRRAPQLETLPGMEPAGWAPATAPGPGLTAEQEEAVGRRAEPLLVSAAAGSGKTSVLVERFVRAVREDGVAPGRILAITFTERAAGELRERVRARLLQLGERGAARDTEAAFVGTFHGFCARLLRASPLAARLDPDFAVLDEGQAGRLRAGAFERAAREFLAERGAPAVDLLAAYGVDRLRAMLDQAYLELRSRGARLPRLPRPSHPQADQGGAAAIAEAELVLTLLDELLERFGIAYDASKRERSALDFDDLELLAGELLLGRESLRDAWAASFELLMVDEFQDTNPRQLAILQALQRENLFTVGDELQSIYGFRHADVELFRARRNQLQERGGVLSLSSNFRSRPGLLAAINAVFAQRFADLQPLVAGRDEIGAGGAESQEPAVELLLTDTNGWEARQELADPIASGLPAAQLWRQAEARMLAARVAALVREGRARPGEIALLFRASGDLEVFERALQLQGLRTLAAVGAFWGHQQIRDLEAYLRALANPLEEQALYGVLASPLGDCTRDCLALLATAARRGRIGLWEAAQLAVRREDEPVTAPPEPAIAAETAIAPLQPALAEQVAEPLSRLSPQDRAALARVVALLRRERAVAPRHTLAELLERAIDASGYRQRVLALEWGQRRLANVHKLLRLAREFEAREGRDLRAFLDYVDYLRETARVEPDAPVDGTEPDAVRLMTVHAAKGLEFPVVCVADLGRQPNARTPDLIVDGGRIGFRLMRVEQGDSQPALAYEELCAERREREAEEEDRIMYVAMTRARELLLLSGSANFARWPRRGPGGAPISWLAPAICEELPEMLAAGEEPPAIVALDSREAARVRLRLNSALAPEIGDSPGPGGVPPGPGSGPGRGLGQAPSGPPGAPPSPGAGEPARAAEPSSPAEPPVTAQAPPGAGLTTPDPAATTMSRISTFSYSSLTELERCGYRYYLERVLRLPEDRAAARMAAAAAGEPVEEGLDPRARGTLVHRLMELLDFSSPQPPTPQEVGERARELGLRMKPAEREELSRLVAASCAAEPAARVAAARRISREHPFAFALTAEEPLVNGVIDLLARERDGTSLVLDYKSDRVPAGVSAAELEELVERDYAVQRLLYALAVLRDGAENVEVVHWFLEPNAWVSVRFGAADRLTLEERLAQRLAAARGRGFAVSGHPHRALCLTCPGRTGLCSWSETETLREHP